MLVSLDEVKEFFFRAMLAGWVSSDHQQHSGVAAIPGYKQYEFREGRLNLIDLFCTHHKTGKSAGSTTILCNAIPVWVMHYGGWYKKRAYPLLKRALREAYEAREFCGGRGRESFIDGSLEYRNERLNYFDFAKFRESSFSHFIGREAIAERIDGALQELGHHHYFGMSLFSDGKE